ncbi:MAG: hypothetical protein FWF02_10465 [Micrococcales bacterium]|nr:hypothetical protein [Micrococcales bacterium]MCL2668110.1 hypothetical protein [Micrococcales bacterium]
MAGIEYFEESVRILKQAAIDAWMVDVGGFTLISHAQKTKGGDGYYRKYWGEIGIPYDGKNRYISDVYENVSRTVGGVGGGAVWYEAAHVTSGTNELDHLKDGRIGIESSRYVDQFQTVCATIEDIVDPWREVVDLSKTAPIVQQFTKVATELGQGNLGTGGDLLADCSDLVTTMQSSHLRGETISNFRKAVIAKLDPKIYMGGTPLKALCAVGVALTSHAAAEQAAWEQACTQASEILNNAFLKFTEVAKKSDPTDWKQLLEVAHIAAEVALAVIPGGKAWTILKEGVELVLLVKEYAPQPISNTHPAYSYENVMKALRLNLQELNTQIKNTEENLRNRACGNLDTIAKNKEHFALRPEAIVWDQKDYDDYNAYSRDYDPSNDVIQIYRSDVLDVKASLVKVAGDFREIARIIEPVHPEISPALARDSRLGLGPNGPAVAFMELAELLHDLLATFAWCVEETGHDLVLACDAILAQDEATQATLLAQAEYMKLDDQFNGQSGIDLWDFSTREIKDDTAQPPVIESLVK